MATNTILFDLDGTLVDSANEISVILNAMRKERGLSALADTHFRQKISYGAGEIVKCSLPPTKESPQILINEFRERYTALTIPKTSIYPTVVETLSVLKDRGIQLGICTNKPQNLCDNVLRDTELERFFSYVIAGRAQLQPKPHHESISLAMSDMDADTTTTVLVGDSTADQRAAQSANIPFIFFAAGYDDGVDENQAFASIEVMRELLKINLF
ncbi:HAD family hydrolase [Magnetovibrio blakemorei]|uniref:phosphoglycolate phosphatase n=1 Tax=Magnetovibrio blakemorei TaxID=28181 RepID=A0A1E5QC45_9PROT|nr:HAD family hydrolase [Magnetovibrio blakemorei]OEJ69557.1 hypothetical protein BEN30_02435 [Magnetovibrio blakemorei]